MGHVQSYDKQVKQVAYLIDEFEDHFEFITGEEEVVLQMLKGISTLDQINKIPRDKKLKYVTEVIHRGDMCCAYRALENLCEVYIACEAAEKNPNFKPLVNDAFEYEKDLLVEKRSFDFKRKPDPFSELGKVEEKKLYYVTESLRMIESLRQKYYPLRIT